MFIRGSRGLRNHGHRRTCTFATDPRLKWAGIALIAIALIALPFALAMAGTAWVRITNLAILFVLLSLGLNIVVGFAGLLDLGYIAFYAVGAYVYALLASPHFGLHLPWWMILPIGAAVACFFGVLLGHAHPQAARRLPRHRDAGLRRDHPHLPQQPLRAVQPHQRARRASRPSTRSASSAIDFGGDDAHRLALVSAGPSSTTTSCWPC